MPLHPQVSKFLEEQAAIGAKPIEQFTLAEFRRSLQEVLATRDQQESVAVVEDLEIPGQAGPIPVRIVRPTPSHQLPALIFFHGGGWVAGNLETHDPLCRTLAIAAGCAVIAVDYRLAPEHKYPAAAEDCFAVYNWACQEAATLKIDGRRIAVGGDSAGGNLAAVVSLMARDLGRQPPRLQVLLYPILDRNLNTASYMRCAEGYRLTRVAMQSFWNHYLTDEQDATHSYAAPLQATHLQGLAAAIILTAEYDVLCDEGESYAGRLREADVPTEYTRYDGMIHGFLTRLNLFDTGRIAIDQIANALKCAFAADK